MSGAHKEDKMLQSKTNYFNSICRISGSENHHNYQVWYRNGKTVNFSSALELCDYLLLTKKKILEDVKVYVYDVESSSAMCGMLDAMGVSYELVTCPSEAGDSFDFVVAFDNINKQYYNKFLV